MYASSRLRFLDEIGASLGRDRVERSCCMVRKRRVSRGGRSLMHTQPTDLTMTRSDLANASPLALMTAFSILRPLIPFRIPILFHSAAFSPAAPPPLLVAQPARDGCARLGVVSLADGRRHRGGREVV